MVKVDYSTYLKTDKWREKSRERMTFDGYKCKACGRGDVTLNVHHLTYRNVGNEPLRDLITLCENCHKNHHLIKHLEDECEAMYAKAEQEKLANLNGMTNWETEQRRREQLKNNATREIEENHLEDDYSKNGSIDMCNWTVIEKFCKEKEAEYKSKYGIQIWISKQDIRDYFFCRRLELLSRCIDKGLSPETVVKKSMLNQSFVSKWYDIGKINKRLEQEKLIGG